MRLALVTSVYPQYARQFYHARPGLARQSFDEQRQAIDGDSYAWLGVWPHFLAPLGYDALDVIVNLEPLQRAWARENYARSSMLPGLESIALEQIRRFKPDILWFDGLNPGLIREARRLHPGALAMGWVGSAIPESSAWRDLDVVLSCAPESVQILASRGVEARHLDHAFDPRINARLPVTEKSIDLSFIGQIQRGTDFHLNRETVLLALATAEIPLSVYSASYEYGPGKEAEALAKMLLYDLAGVLKRAGMPLRALEAIPLLGRAASWRSRPLRPLNPSLRPYLRPNAYGLQMYELLRRSLVSLNIHADSSPSHASNMRLFEITGVGTCMLCDWRANLPDLFEPDAEVVTYRSAAECAEKARWLMDHPDRARAIGVAGQARCLRDHGFARRAEQLDGIIRSELRRLKGNAAA